MNTKELVTKAIRAGIKYSEDTYWDEPKELDRMASTLSLGLITLTEERLREMLMEAYEKGFADRTVFHHMSGGDYVSSAIERLKKEI